MSAARGIDAEFLGFLDLHLFVDQLVDDLLPDRRLVGGQEVELGALLDVVIGDGFAVDHDDDVLRMQRASRA